MTSGVYEFIVVGGGTAGIVIDTVQKERGYAANAYYLLLKDRKNLEVVTNAVVEKILSDHGSQPPKAIGVQYRHEAHTKTALVSKEVVAAGSLQSPKLLEVSSVGNAGILQPLGTGVVKELKGVGENLHSS